VLELARRIAKHDPGRFSKPAVPIDDLRRVSNFLSALAELKTKAEA
jgi:hypothetical protein